MFYQPTQFGILTYFIPRVHSTVSEQFMKETLTAYWASQSGLGFAAMKCNPLKINRISFIPIENNPNFKQAFVYHVPSSIDSLQDIEFQLVSRFTEDLFKYEEAKCPLKCHLFHNGKSNFWMLLPNRNPLTSEQEELTKFIKEANACFIEDLGYFTLEKGIIPVSISIDSINQPIIETGFTSQTPESIFQQLKVRLDEIKNAHLNLQKVMDKEGIPTAEDRNHMYELTKEQEKECSAAREDDEEVYILRQQATYPDWSHNM